MTESAESLKSLAAKKGEGRIEREREEEKDLEGEEKIESEKREKNSGTGKKRNPVKIMLG